VVYLVYIKQKVYKRMLIGNIYKTEVFTFGDRILLKFNEDGREDYYGEGVTQAVWTPSSTYADFTDEYAVVEDVTGTVGNKKDGDNEVYLQDASGKVYYNYAANDDLLVAGEENIFPDSFVKLDPNDSPIDVSNLVQVDFYDIQVGDVIVVNLSDEVLLEFKVSQDQIDYRGSDGCMETTFGEFSDEEDFTLVGKRV